MQHPTFKKLKIFLLGVSFIFLLMLGLNVKLSIVRFGSEEARAVDASGFSYDVVDNCLRVDTEFCPLPVKVDSPQLCISGDCKSSWGAVSGFWSDGGSGRIYYNGGNVGIGTTNPNRLLHVYKTSGDNAEIDIQSVSGSNQHWGIYHDRTTDDLRFWNNDPTGEKNILTLTNDGKVGIGTTNPSEKLEVSGNIKLSGTTPTYRITNVQSPSANSDVATKAYVDAAVAADGGGSMNGGPLLEWKQQPSSEVNFLGIVQMGPAEPNSKFAWRIGEVSDWSSWQLETGGSGGTRTWQRNFSAELEKTIYIFGKDVGGEYSNLLTSVVGQGIPLPPSRLTAESRVGWTEIRLAFQDSSIAEDGFYVYRSTYTGFMPSPLNRIASLPPQWGAGSYVYWNDTGLGGSNYYYRVSAYSVVGESAYSNEAYGYVQVCGDSTIEGSEGCDDGNTSWTQGWCAGDCGYKNAFVCDNIAGRDPCVDSSTAELNAQCCERTGGRYPKYLGKSCSSRVQEGSCWYGVEDTCTTRARPSVEAWRPLETEEGYVYCGP